MFIDDKTVLQAFIRYSLLKVTFKMSVHVGSIVDNVQGYNISNFSKVPLAKIRWELKYKKEYLLTDVASP